MTDVFKKYGNNPISYTASIGEKIKAINDDLIKKIDEYYSIISNIDYSKIKQALNRCLSEPSEDNINGVFEEINLINNNIIKDNIYNIFYKVYSI